MSVFSERMLRLDTKKAPWGKVGNWREVEASHLSCQYFFGLSLVSNVEIIMLNSLDLCETK